MRLLLIALLLAGCSSFEEPARPNIVIVLLDDLGYSDYSASGSKIRTPAIDDLAANGVSIDQFYVMPRCSPTRAALLTGEDPHVAGLGFLPLPAGAEVSEGPYQGYLNTDLETLPETLHRLGYATYMSGKWHLGEAPEHWPRRRGFERYFGLISGASSYYELLEGGPFKRTMVENDTPWQPPSEGFYMTDAFTDRALAYLSDHLNTQPEKPFFLYLAYTAPHWPLHAPEAEIASYDDTFEASAAANADADLMATYAAQVTIADRGIGRVLDLLRQRGALENSLVLVFSDNGASAEDISNRGLHRAGASVGTRDSYLSYGEHWATVSNAPLRGHKGSTLEGGVRTPLIAHWPKGAVTGGRVDHRSVVSVQDIMPAAIAAASGGDASLLDVLNGSAETPDRTLFWAHTGWRALRDGDWKAVKAPGDVPWQLYKISSDPEESRPVEDPARIQAMADRWQEWSESVGAEADFDPRQYYRKLR